MGYNTNHRLTTHPPELVTQAKALIYEVVQARSKYEGLPFDDEPVRWYDLGTDMAEASARIPGVLLILDAEGEETGDIWCQVWLAGDLIWSWTANVTRPGIPSDVLCRVDATIEARDTGIAKLTAKERAALGLS